MVSMVCHITLTSPKAIHIGECHLTVTKIGKLITESEECHVDDTPLSFYETFPSSPYK
jgi:hypothetical protein